MNHSLRYAALLLAGSLAACIPLDPTDTSEQLWTMQLASGAPIRSGFPAEMVDVTIPSGVTSSVFNQVDGQWYVLDRLNNVVPIRFTQTFVSNEWSFTGTGGPSPDGMLVQLRATGRADASYPMFTEASGDVTLSFTQPGLPAVTQTADWYAWRN